MEKYIWSLDISTTNIGSALWSSKGKLIELKHLELKIDKKIVPENRLIHKAQMFKEYVLEYKERLVKELNGEIIQIIVEQPIGGSVNANTVAMLLEFNGMARYILYEIFEIHPILISVHNSRKIFCSELIQSSTKKNRKTGQIETVETLSFPLEYKDKKKLYIWKKVNKLEPHIKWFYKTNGELKDTNYDMSDSYAVGYAGLKQLGIINGK